MEYNSDIREVTNMRFPKGFVRIIKEYGLSKNEKCPEFFIISNLEFFISFFNLLAIYIFVSQSFSPQIISVFEVINLA